MYKGFYEDLEYVAGLFFKPFEDCFAKGDDDDDDEEKKCGLGCDGFCCCGDSEDDDEEEDEYEDEDDKKGASIMSSGPVADILKCLFDASEIDYDYED
jgi:hypothetical protein